MSVSINNNDNIEEQLRLAEPERTEENLYCDILNGKQCLYVQTPKMNFNIEEDTLHLLFNNKNLSPFYKLLRDIESCLCKILSNNSETWFSQKLSKDIIKQDLFKSCISTPSDLNDPLKMTVKLPYNIQGQEDFEVYNRSKKKLNLDFLKKNNTLEGTFLLLAKEIVISSTRAIVEWELVQVLVHTKKKKIKGFGIREEKLSNTESKTETKIENQTETKIENQTETKTEKEESSETQKKTTVNLIN